MSRQRKVFTEAEDATIRLLVPTLGISETARTLGVHREKVRDRAKDLRVASAKRLSSMVQVDDPEEIEQRKAEIVPTCRRRSHADPAFLHHVSPPRVFRVSPQEKP